MRKTINTNDNTTVRRNANAVFSQNLTSKKNTSPANRAISQQRGITAYRRNNESSGKNKPGAQPAALVSFNKSVLGTGQQTLAAAGIKQTLATAKNTAGTAAINNAIKNYANLSSGVNNTSDLIARGADVYKKTRYLNPLSLKSLQSGQDKKSITTITIPPTATTLFNRGITEYILNSGAEDSTNEIDLFLKVGPKRMIESQLFI